MRILVKLFTAEGGYYHKFLLGSRKIFFLSPGMKLVIKATSYC